MISQQHSQGNTSWAGMRVIQKDTSHKPAAYIEAFPKCVSLSSSASLSHAAGQPRLLTACTKNGLEYGGPAICADCNFKASKSLCYLVQIQCRAPFPSQLLFPVSVLHLLSYFTGHRPQALPFLQQESAAYSKTSLSFSFPHL